MAFTVIAKTENGFDKIILKDNSNETTAEIIPSCGAILHAFTVLHNGIFLNVIEQYDDAADFASNVAGKGFKSCKLSPFACRIKNATYRFGEKQYTIEKFLLHTSALHGLLYDADFSILQKQADEEKASVTVQHQYRGSDKGYPFHYDCIVKYTLQKENTLNIITEIINKSESPIPVQDGWHPYFTLGGKINGLELQFQSKEKLVMDDALIPTGEKIQYDEFGSIKKINNKSFDDCFTLKLAGDKPLCVLRDAEKKIQIEIKPDSSYPYLQIYTPDDRNSIAFENLSAAPDAFNNGLGLVVAAPQTKTIFTTAFRITSLI